MASVDTFLNFHGHTEAAFEHYRSIFGTDYDGPITRLEDLPAAHGAPRPAAQERWIAHMALPILGGHVLRGSDRDDVTRGNNVSIYLSPDTREEADRLFAALAADGEVLMPMADQFWGAYFGDLVDRFGVQWLVSVDHA